jgi:integrase
VPTVEKLADLYLEKWAKHKRTRQEDERQLKKDVVPVLGTLKARDVTRGHIRALLDALVERGAPVAANRLLAVVQRMFALAAEKEIIPSSPCQGLKMPSREEPKDRVLTPEEIRTFWRAMDGLPETIVRKGRPRLERRPPEEPHAVSDGVRRALKLILVTAQRPGEVAGMTWEEIEGEWWTIPAARSKNGLSHRVHLSSLALEILGPRGEGYVFPSPRLKVGHIHRSALAHALKRGSGRSGARAPGDELVPLRSTRFAASLWTVTSASITTATGITLVESSCGPVGRSQPLVFSSRMSA